MSKFPVADTILEQLGGNKFIAMTGAKSLVANENSLTFRLPRGCLNRATYCTIELAPNDTYTVTFGRIVKTNYVTVSEHTQVYCDMLQDLFLQQTGLYTRF